MENILVQIPENLENIKLPDPSLLQFYKNVQDRVIWIDFSIDDNLLDVVKLIIEINKRDAGIPSEDREPIKICIFSYGGNIDSTFTMIDVCRLSKTPIITINFGVAMSAGILIFLAGHKRLTFNWSQFLIHSGSGGAAGTYEQTEAAMQNYKKAIEIMRKYILERTNIDTKLFNRNKSKEWYIYAEESLSLGICDKIIDDIDEIF